jgi:hypothetical protein
MSGDDLIHAVLNKDWFETVEILFGDNPLFPDYKYACLTKDLVKAKELVRQGKFAEHDYLWNPDISEKYLFRSLKPLDILLIKNLNQEDYINLLVDYGLLDMKKCKRFCCVM